MQLKQSLPHLAQTGFTLVDASDFTIAASTLTKVSDPGKATCMFIYTPATGTLGAPPALSDC